MVILQSSPQMLLGHSLTLLKSVYRVATMVLSTMAEMTMGHRLQRCDWGVSSLSAEGRWST